MICHAVRQVHITTGSTATLDKLTGRSPTCSRLLVANLLALTLAQQLANGWGKYVKLHSHKQERTEGNLRATMNIILLHYAQAIFARLKKEAVVVEKVEQN